MKLQHRSRIEARQELSAHGYNHAFSSPGRPALWVRPGHPRDRKAIRISLVADGIEYCDIVSYPEPSTATEAEATILREKEAIAHVEIPN